MKSSFSSTLIQERRKKGLNQDDLATFLNVTRSTISDYERGKSEPPLGNLLKLADKFHISLDELVGRDASLINYPKNKENASPNASLNASLIEESEEKNSIPLYPIEAIAGSPCGDISVRESDVEGYYVVPEFKASGVEFMIRVKGSSMYPKYSSGDLVGCRKIKDLTFFQWGKVYILDTDQGPLIKRLYPHENKDFIVCHSDNTELYPRFEINRSSIRNVYIVIGVIRLE